MQTETIDERSAKQTATMAAGNVLHVLAGGVIETVTNPPIVVRDLEAARRILRDVIEQAILKERVRVLRNVMQPRAN